MARENGTFFVLLILFLFTGSVYAEDTDRDGLSDELELQIGSSATHKDIFVHIDWLVVKGRSMKPRANFAQIATSIFEAAPVYNPDGMSGIRLHISWGRAINSTREAIGSFDSTGYNWQEFDSIKLANFPSSRRQTHHYCLFVKDIGDESGLPSGISGFSRNKLTSIREGASDFVVALGGPGWWNKPTGPEYKWTQVGTFIHELGHNLGLVHGGVDSVSYKPNHLSVMSYAYQTLGIPITARDGSESLYYLYDYSRLFTAGLNENAACDFRGLGQYDQVTTADARYGARWWRSDHPDDYLEDFDAIFVDWNNDGNIPLSCDANVKYPHHLNIRYDDALTDLKASIPEWHSLVYTGGQIGKSITVALPVTTNVICMKSSDQPKPRLQSKKNVTKGTYMDVILQ